MRTAFLIFLFAACHSLWATSTGAVFTENKGQWPAQVLYRALVPGGALYVERQALTYLVGTGHGHHHDHDEPGHVHKHVPQWHAWRVHFVDGNATGSMGSAPLSHKENYFIGSDPAAWGTDCSVFGEVLLQDVWPGVDMRLTGDHGLKYEMILAPGVDPAIVRFEYEGQDQLLLEQGELHVVTSTVTVVEQAPVSFSRSDAGRSDVASQYHLDGTRMTFHFPDGHDPGLPLVIDPVLSFSSFSGSTANNFGFTATYDAEGHLYGGGIAFSTGYPVTVGALDLTFNGGIFDVALSKFSPDGSTLIWSTYFGGSEGEAPHSLVTNEANELFVLGSTGSLNLPVTPGAFQPAHNGGPSAVMLNSYTQPDGIDAFILRLSADGSAMLGSTYFGGNGSDGVNLAQGLNYNYGDMFRGEIILNDAGEPIIVTSTSSTDMPTTMGAPQASFGGGTQDAFMLRMNADLTSLLWATYYGGSGSDSGYGVQVSSTGNIYCTGGTNSVDLPMNGVPHQSSNAGGVDAYIVRYNPGGNIRLSSTHLGTAQYDQSYFVQLDPDDDVYVVGQTSGNYPVTAGKYAVPGSSQFIHKLSTDLSTSIWSTRFGNGNGDEDISPTAFLVSDCRQIYFSGWGGTVNNTQGLPTASTTQGLPVTPDAFMSNSEGSDLYLMVLEPEAEGLNYATFFGGSSGEHVDGGTSRFDKNGKVYQAVCAGCHNQSDFPTTPGAWSNTNGSSGCNLGVIKFDLSTVIAVISVEAPDMICAGSVLEFSSTSSGGDTYHWTFSDGASYLEPDVIHTFTEPGTYTVTLEVSDSHECVLSDVVTLEVHVAPDIVAQITPIGILCPGEQVQLVASPPGFNYAWTPESGLSDPTIPDPIASPDVTTTYKVVISGECGIDSTTVEVVYADLEWSVFPDVTICLGESTTLGATGGTSYSWSPPQNLSDPTSATPVATPQTTTTYTVTMNTTEGCVLVEQMQVEVISGVPQPVLHDLTLCAGSSVQLHAPPADWHQWEPAPGLEGINFASPVVSPQESTTYVVLCGNACGEITDTVHVEVLHINALVIPDTIVCPGTELRLYASGGTSYEWSPALYLSDATSPFPICTPQGDVSYTVRVVNAAGCAKEVAVDVKLHPEPWVYAGPDQEAEWGKPVLLQADGEGIFNWQPAEYVNDPGAQRPFARPGESTLFKVALIDTNGCSAADSTWVILHSSVFIPNAFTPNDDGINDHFGAWGTDVVHFRMWVYDRWGELIFESRHIDERWDGSYRGEPCITGAYVWNIEMEERTGNRRSLIGHVNLLR